MDNKSSIKKKYLLVFLLVAVGVTLPFYYWLKPEPLTPEDELIIQEAVLNNYFEIFGSRHLFISFYISVQGSDPSQKLLKIFEDYEHHVAPKSKIETSQEFEDSSKIGYKRMIISIRDISQKLDGKVEVEADFNAGPWDGAGYEYLLENKEGNWQIISKKLVWIL